MRLRIDEIIPVLSDKLIKHNVPREQAELIARTIAENDLDGVFSHGINRFPGLIYSIDAKEALPGTIPERTFSFGALEGYDGKRGLGIVNAHFCVYRAVHLAETHGIACVALRNTNHWFRGATYGYQACKANMASICMTNTMPNMPTWGALDARLGNNPLVFAFPRKDGDLVCDMAMSQFAYGSLEVAAQKNRIMPVDAGFDKDGNLTRDPISVIESGRILPTGYWKGAALAQLVDVFAAGISLGNTTAAISRLGGNIDVSQLFIVINCKSVDAGSDIERIVEETVNYITASQKMSPDSSIIYSGQIAVEARVDGLKNGIEIEESNWRKVLEL